MQSGFQRLVLLLLAAALFLPIAIVLILTVSRLLAALEDPAGALALGRAALVVGILWALVLVCLPLVLAMQTLWSEPQRRDDDEGE